ncbi:O-antigen ligase family protein [Pontixanthobacter aquaemixtae]|uniref:O-antigen ligase-related domain-containing protein n=1 Tax=Pontixanthobacter aquaemixtae TaxID=1958940 RepID=A0A844ZTZ0_9SPHN|nr:O-antigen ligase family protein [Pontixanthobacter aquaemixtae]MXO91345.1 hypothetical protein [Pontixanthobacter aquaemixtae]
MKILRGDTSASLGKGWIVVALFALAVAFLGGSSRPDAIQTVALRSMAALFLIPIIYYYSADRMRPVKVPLVLLALLGGWMAIQIIPLPPGLWRSLPGTDPVAELSGLLGLAETWRPISFVPVRTLNALASLVVPLVALALPVALGLHRSTVLIFVVIVGLSCAILGAFQLTGGAGSPLYFYEYVNRGSPTGFLANRNHSAVLLSLALVTTAYLLVDNRRRKFQLWQKFCLGGAFLAILTIALISGSRAGLITGLVALAACGLLFFLKNRETQSSRDQGPGRSSPPYRSMAVGGVVLALLVFALFLAFGRIPAIDRLVDGGPWEDMRWSVLPTLWEMMKTYALFGAGFGSFEEVYHIYEPTELLLPNYLNMAHNDWAQLVIEGGLPAILILGAFFLWMAKSMGEMGAASRQERFRLVYWVSVFAIISIGSLADYPLRAPLFQAVAMWLVGCFALELKSLRNLAKTDRRA